MPPSIYLSSLTGTNSCFLSPLQNSLCASLAKRQHKTFIVVMFGTILIFISTLAPYQLNHNYTGNVTYYELPRFWTNTGLCPAGALTRESLRESLLSQAMQMNLRHIAALPTGAITHVRIHWLLELLEFVQYTQQGVPIWNFDDLDMFLMNIDDWGLQPVMEFMGNPGEVFTKNPHHNAELWEDLAHQVAKRYLNLLGAAKVLRWRFETWNEPDLKHYNLINFTTTEYLSYVSALRRGLTAAGRRPVNSLYFPLRGPAGLFKAQSKHPLCWGIVEECNKDPKQCPLDVLTYHRKGNGSAQVVLDSSLQLLRELFQAYPALAHMPIANDEADPIAGWSTTHDFHEDVRYAHILINIVLGHWSAMLDYKEFTALESISHDNAFLSYHPYEFSQRTLLAHFRMNNSVPLHSQFIQKPVYAALGMLSKLAPLAAAVEILTADDGVSLQLLKTTVASNKPLYLSWLLLPRDSDTGMEQNFTWHYQLPFEWCAQETFAYAVELLAPEVTDPAFVWRSMGLATPYPNATLREQMRRRQTPKLLATGLLQANEVIVSFDKVQRPWVQLLRVCSILMPVLKQPQELEVTKVTHGEVLITWREVLNSTQCLKSYEVWFQSNESSEWQFISEGWHLPFPSFQYAPMNEQVNGFYKVRSVNLFNNKSKFSQPTEYLEV